MPSNALPRATATLRRRLAAPALAAAAALLAAVAGAAPLPSAPPPGPVPAPEHRALAREIYAELIGITTTERTGITPAAEALAARFRAAGFPAGDVVLVGPSDKNRNLVVRLRGRGKEKPIGYFVHLDVVEALREAWSVDPYTLTERDGYFYGRGAEDTKATAAALAATLLRMKREGFVPRGDVVAAFTSDEEGGPENGVDWLLKNRRDLVDVQYALNLDGGQGSFQRGQRIRYAMSVGEKLYATYSVTFSNPGGHSSRPEPDNAIYRLANALTRIEQYRFPVRLNEATRALLLDEARRNPALAADLQAVVDGRADETTIERVARQPYLNAIMRTTCVPTLLQAGQAENALPMRARVTIQCRLLPDEDTAAMPGLIARLAGDPQAEVRTVWEPIVAPASKLNPKVRAVAERIIGEMWPGTPLIPSMEVGSTDGTYLRGAGIPTFDASGLFYDLDDRRAHARDERILVQAFYEAVEYQYRFMKALHGR